ncbi:AAA family ATPase [Paraburkholderia phosphatilytica]|uniref:AAA family ATPase n=1 Tax=Paraburkholderia phosphatilytica TaxID=2282883 RepID=UPI000E4B441C|nr:ATP-binding protein [Paraburkholderia phosphatilytica]
MTRLIFFCGHAGTGKTTLAKRLIGPLIRSTGEAFCLLDKDVMYGPVGAAAMQALIGDPNDRDSPLYLQHFRDPEYRALIDTARDNLALGINVIAVAPLSREIRERRLVDRAWLDVGDDVAIHVVWVEADDHTVRERIAARGDPADAYKLAHWDAYLQRRFVPTGDARRGLLSVNTTSATSADYDALLAVLAAEPAATPDPSR